MTPQAKSNTSDRLLATVAINSVKPRKISPRLEMKPPIFPAVSPVGSDSGGTIAYMIASNIFPLKV